MHSFAVWAGRAGAMAAAVLAAVWLVQAYPDPGSATAWQARTDCLDHARGAADLAARRGDMARYTNELSRQTRCLTSPDTWDQGLLNRSLIAAGGSLLLLMASAMIPRPEPTAPPKARLPPRGDAEIEAMVQAERDAHHSIHGTVLPIDEARARVHRRIQPDG